MYLLAPNVEEVTVPVPSLVYLVKLILIAYTVVSTLSCPVKISGVKTGRLFDVCKVNLLHNRNNFHYLIRMAYF